MQSVGEMWYSMIANMVENVLGKDGKPFFPLVFSLFSFVLIANMLGMFPYFFTVTSHVIVTAGLAVFVVALVVVWVCRGEMFTNGAGVTEVIPGEGR